MNRPKKRLRCPDRAERIENTFIRCNRWLGMLWQRFWAIVLLIPAMLILKSCISSIAIADWPSAIVCGIGGSLFLFLSSYLWRRGGKDGFLETFFD